MKFTVTGTWHRYGTSTKTNKPYNFVVVSGNFKDPRYEGLRAKEYNVDMDILGGVLPKENDVLDLYIENDRVLGVEWISHASETSAQSSAGSAAKTVGNNYGQTGSK